ncbi:LacI family transcriptional regulator [Pontibacter qinzhouensis]|uniref:LacI family transcriptional regulator n=1 Tax=Pontibacter qinzhouensis TaxID=2603253 RepID=A0A5C8KB33_9BACT|nr:LacI family DNA-binding transcriptional regulator [Pontibacter qinzhouensis]TXK52161.1 LacI family transcriptional regulator [Pontibacter qinzhouensis]
MQKVTIHDIARELNITFSTVARALNDHPAISVTTKEAVRETAKRLGYRQNKVASSLRSGRTNIIGVVVPSLDVSFFSSVVHGIERVMHENGYSILLYQSNESLKQETKGIATFLASRVDGIIASVTAETFQYEHYTEIKKRNVPLLFFDRTLDELQVPSVTINDYKGGFMATEHLIRKGYKRIVHISSERNLPIFSERLRGYTDALAYYDLPFDENLVFRGNISMEYGKTCVDALLEKQVQFDAIFALEDYMAMGAIHQLLAHGITVPDQVGVIGFANEAFGAYITPTLSTIDQQTVKMGEEVANLFLKLSKNKKFYEAEPERVVLEPLLMIRQSTAR